MASTEARVPEASVAATTMLPGAVITGAVTSLVVVISAAPWSSPL